MRRFVVLLILVAAIVVAVGWFASDPGSVAVRLRGWQVETSAGVLVLAVAFIASACVALWAVVAWLVAAPARLRRWRADRRRARGLRALAAGMVAVAAGDTKGARRAARRAQLAAGETPLTLLLGAQSAQLEGDAQAAEKFFTAMLARPETEFLALRGLLIQARNKGDDVRALELAERATAMKRNAGWAHLAVFDLAVARCQWKKADAALVQSIRLGAVEKYLGARHRAALLLAEAREAERTGFVVEALALARRAERADGTLVAAPVMRARLDAAQGSQRRARRTLLRAFARVAHPEIAQAYLSLAETGDQTRERLLAAQKLLSAAPGAAEAHITAAEVALAASLWGKARGHVDDADNCLSNDGRLIPARHFRLRAEIEERENGDAAAVAGWLRRAAQAAPDPRWVCTACGETAPAWAPVCGACGGFDTLAWQAPAPLVALPAGAASRMGMGLIADETPARPPPARE